ncbi:protein kinase (plasmid) [Gemmatirosa kalamazoonensis]|uniref:Protein kinase n=1 Tax=Gemmatirosa kalamazoonensis TaxID=861299 RepID=W0RU54_9BACT|nr:serine/threonine-protein kinase [Gemmatirosa kalamazoonensis]AHG93845.1 protein kinase [Gemmatirosa kalamazoonensis]
MTDEQDVLDRLQAELGDRYRIERELGGGGMSRVFVAIDETLGRRVAIKVLRPTLAAALSVERFRREVELAAGLQHPNIVPVLSAGTFAEPAGGAGEGSAAQGVPYFVMPYVDGESLRERLVRGPVSVREAVSVARDVARALSFAHGRGVVHRDIKPGNILLSAGAAVVTDFGVAKALQASAARPSSGERRARPLPERPSGAGGGATLTAIGTSLGTPAYMAPEQAAADPNVDFRADLYALGVVMYEMLVGSPPFHGRTPQALLTAQMSETPPPIAARRYDVPMALAALIMHCLEKDSTRRPRSAAEVLRTLEEPDILSGAFATPPVVARRRRSQLLTLALPLVAVIVAVGALWALRPGTKSRAADSTAVAAAAGAALTLPSPPPLARSIAVLSFDAVGRDERAASIGEGLTAEIATALAGVPGMRVASQSGSAALRARRAAPVEIARTLGVTLLLEGTVQREGERVRVTVRAVDPAIESTVWSRTFDGQTTNVLALQDLVSSAIVAAFDRR